MFIKKPATDDETQKKLEEERQKLIVQTVKLPNGATYTRLKPVVNS
jgi:hypothetical protein